PRWKMDSFKRLAGHKKALAEFGLSYNEQLTFEGTFEESSGREAMKYLLQVGIPFTGVVCANDEMAAGVMETAREQGLKVPEDFSIIGFDNVSFSRFLHPKLSSIDCRIDEMGQMAARCVLKNMYGETDIEVQNSFEPNLILRESVKRR
ncbi:MAG TPA: substrate-binding domain-containing protein, partial [Paracoccaceae bacterium]|nr:substrate-binding domain-containing protein [Paracoccaceae bacterium]